MNIIWHINYPVSRRISKRTGFLWTMLAPSLIYHANWSISVTNRWKWLGFGSEFAILLMSFQSYSNSVFAVTNDNDMTEYWQSLTHVTVYHLSQWLKIWSSLQFCLNYTYQSLHLRYKAIPVYANYIGPSVMADANCEKFTICDDRITENDRCFIKIIGIHCHTLVYTVQNNWSNFTLYGCLVYMYIIYR